MKLKTFFFFLFFLLQLQIYSQSFNDQYLLKTLAQYEEVSESEKESVWNDFLNQFEEKIKGETALQLEEITVKLEALYMRIAYSQTEDKNYTLFNVTKGFADNNYFITEKTAKNSAKIVLKQNNVSDYITDIHLLKDGKLLIIARQDDMSFSCYKGYLLDFDTKIEKHFDNDAFLSVCSWTNVDETRIVENDNTELYEMEGKIKTYQPIKINFEPKTNTISYQFNRQKEGKQILRKSTYKNGNFKIKSYDARTFEE